MEEVIYQQHFWGSERKSNYTMHQPYYLIQQRISTGQNVALRTGNNKAEDK